MPIRTQRKRSKGWRMPENTVYVGRGSRWGNPFPTHEPERDGHGDIIPGRKIEVRSAQEAVKLYTKHIMPYSHHGAHATMGDFYLSIANIESIRAELAGKNLCCWCSTDSVCHADVLLTIANESEMV